MGQYSNSLTLIILLTIDHGVKIPQHIIPHFNNILISVVKEDEEMFVNRIKKFELNC